jgi:hypothetical protein
MIEVFDEEFEEVLDLSRCQILLDLLRYSNISTASVVGGDTMR